MGGNPMQNSVNQANGAPAPASLNHSPAPSQSPFNLIQWLQALSMPQLPPNKMQGNVAQFFESKK